MSTTDIKEVVKEKYGQAALRVKSGRSSCCGATASSGGCEPMTPNLYDSAQAGQIRRRRCGLAGRRDSDGSGAVERGETVLDPARAGASMCCFPRTRGADGKAYGLDTTDEMLALANENKRKRESKTSSS